LLGYDVVVTDVSCPSLEHIRGLLQSVEIVLVDLTTANQEILATIYDLNAAIAMCDVAPRLLCFSTAHRNAQIVLDIEKCGARYARVSDPPTLVEAIELLLADMDDLRRNRPCFHILHRFAHENRCSEGEEVSAVLFPRSATDPQLRLALSERLVFNFLAQHHRLAYDARQISAALSGAWFYRDHAANSGVRQRAKIRVPAVKVVVGRIRSAMALKFAEANLQINPLDVLQSLLSAGSGNRVLYKLNADVQFYHSKD
jgi:hypothetical protein